MKELHCPSIQEIAFELNMLEKEMTDIILYDKNASVSEYCKKIESSIKKHFVILPRWISMHDEKDLPFRYFRVRRGFPDFHKHLISEYSYRPAISSTDFQRANIPYHPVMYCASEPMTALLETIRNNEFDSSVPYHISEWVFRPNVSVSNTSFVLENVPTESEFGILSDGNLKKINDKLSSESPKTRNDLINVLKFYCKLFITDSKYLISGCLAHKYVYANDEYFSELLSYPSFQTGGRSVNFAIHPNTVMQKMELKQVVRVFVKNVDLVNWKCEISCDAIAINNSGVLKWHNFIGNEQLFKDLFLTMNACKQ